MRLWVLTYEIEVMQRHQSALQALESKHQLGLLGRDEEPK